MARRARMKPEGEREFLITGRCHNRDWFSRPLPDVWDIFSCNLHFISHGFGVRVRAFVLMSNHYHLLLTVDSATLSPAMAYLCREVSRQINRESKRINQVWGDRFDSRLIFDEVHRLTAYRYLYQNPLSAGLCERVEEYPYSTLRGLLGFEHTTIPIHDHLLDLKNVEERLAWLNQPRLSRVADWNEIKKVPGDFLSPE